MRSKTGLLRSAWLHRFRGTSWLLGQRGSDHGTVILHRDAFKITRLDFTAARAPAFMPIKHGPLRAISCHPAVELHDAALAAKHLALLQLIAPRVPADLLGIHVVARL